MKIGGGIVNLACSGASRDCHSTCSVLLVSVGSVLYV